MASLLIAILLESGIKETNTFVVFFIGPMTAIEELMVIVLLHLLQDVLCTSQSIQLKGALRIIQSHQ